MLLNALKALIQYLTIIWMEYSSYNSFPLNLQLCLVLLLLLCAISIGMKKATSLIAYIVCLIIFVKENTFLDSSQIFTIAILMFFSFLALSVTLKDKHRSKRLSLFEICNNIVYKLSSLYKTFMSYPISYATCIIMSLCITRLFRTNLILIIDLDHNRIFSHIFIIFSLIIPSIIIFRIVLSIIINIRISSGNINLISIIVSEIINTKHYTIKDIDLNLVCNLFISCFSGLILIDIIVFSHYLEWILSDDLNNISSQNKYLVGTYEDISIPSNSFSNYVTLNRRLGVSYNWLIQNGASPIKLPTGGDDLLDYHMMLNNVNWYRVNGGLYYKESYLKGSFTRNLHRVTSIPVNPNFNWSLNRPSSYTNHRGVLEKIKDVIKNPNSEAEVDGLVCTLFAHLFRHSDNYNLNPQAYDSNNTNTRSGKIDFKVSYSENPILIIEDKNKKGHSILDAMEQVHRYCKNNDFTESMFVMIFKGTKMCAFLHQMDWHTDNNFHLKCPKYQDFLGLEVNSTGVAFIPQSNTFYPQIRVYDITPYPFGSDNLASASIFSYVAGFTDISNKEVGEDFSLPCNDRGLTPFGLSHRQHLLYKHLCLNSKGKFRHC